MQLKIAEQYLESFGNLARTGHTFVVPANLSDMGSMIALTTGMLKDKKGPGPATPPIRPDLSRG